MLSYWRSILIKWFVFPVGLNKVALIKLKITSEAGLNGIVERNRKLYKDRIKDRLSCKRCNAYDITEFEIISNSTLFQCINYFYPLCATDWKNHGITIGNGDGYPNDFFVCGSNISNQYDDLYDYDWNLNGSVTNSVVNKRCRFGMDVDLSDRLPTREPNNPNFTDDEDYSLKGHKQRHLEYIHLFQQFVKKTIIPLLLHLLLQENIKNVFGNLQNAWLIIN